MSDKDLGNCVGGALAVLVIPAYFVLYGWVVSLLWSWFVVPIFHLPYLPVPYAIGVAMLIGMVTHQTSSVHDDRTQREKTINAIGTLLNPLFILGLAYIVKLFI